MYRVLVLHHFVISSLSARLIRFFVSAHDTTLLWSNHSLMIYVIGLKVIWEPSPKT